MADLLPPAIEPTSTPAPVTPPAIETTPTPAPEGALDKGIKSITRFFAKLLGQPDPITGEKNTVVSGGMADKIWNAANTVVAKAETVVNNTANVATAAVEKAGAVTGDIVQKGTEAVNQVKEEVAAVKPSVVETPAAPVAPVAAPVETAPVAAPVETPVAPTPMPIPETTTQPLETLETPKAA